MPTALGQSVVNFNAFPASVRGPGIDLTRAKVRLKDGRLKVAINDGGEVSFKDGRTKVSPSAAGPITLALDVEVLDAILVRSGRLQVETAEGTLDVRKGGGCGGCMRRDPLYSVNLDTL